jgi:hypothetical protein
MRTTVNISDDLLAEARALATRTHPNAVAAIDVVISNQRGSGGLQPGVNLEDREAFADLVCDRYR